MKFIIETQKSLITKINYSKLTSMKVELGGVRGSLITGNDAVPDVPTQRTMQAIQISEGTALKICANRPAQ
jgi:hypothetical protein